MKSSSSKYIERESIPIAELFRGEPGSVGLYIPVPDASGNSRASIARISSAAKRYASLSGKRSTIQTLLVLKYEDDSDLPVSSKMVQVTVIEEKDVSGRSKRYIEGGGVRNRKPRKKKQESSKA